MRRRVPHASILSCVLGVVLAATIAPKLAKSEFDNLSFVVAYCAKHARSIKLSEDRAVLCFDGLITKDQDATAFHELNQNGLFVMRSPGGFAHTAMILSNVLRDKNAIVVLYDYCLSACANYFLIAASKTYVMKNTVVAWHGGPQRIWCSTGGLDPVPPENENEELICRTSELLRTFFVDRRIDDRHVYRPQTAHTKKMVAMVVRDVADKRYAFWMWHPQNHKNHFKSKVAYESYPTSQDDVDDILHRSRLKARIVYDPPRL